MARSVLPTTRRLRLGRNGSVCVFRLERRAAHRSASQQRHRRDHRNADYSGNVHLHDHRDRCKRLLRQPPVRHHHCQPGLPGHHVESHDAAAGNGCLFPYSQQITASGGTRSVYLLDRRRRTAVGTFPQRDGTHQRHAAAAGPLQRHDPGDGCERLQGSRPYSLAILPALPPASGPTLNFAGLMILTVLLAAAGLFVMNRLSI